MPPRKGPTKKKGAPFAPPSVVRGKGGRFVKAPPPPKPGKKAPPPKPKIAQELVKGVVRYRGPGGHFVTKPRKPVPTAIGRGKRRRIVDPASMKGTRVRAPRDVNTVLKFGLHGQSAPRLVEDNAIAGRPTLLRWKGKMYRVDAEDAGGLADLMRVLLSDYVGTFRDILESPQFEVGLLETSKGDVLDFDAMETMDDELADELVGNDAAEDATADFNERASDLLNTLLKPPANAKGTKAHKVARQPGKRPGTPKGDRPKKRKR
jgi:hypothetical protein